MAVTCSSPNLILVVVDMLTEDPLPVHQQEVALVAAAEDQLEVLLLEEERDRQMLMVQDMETPRAMVVVDPRHWASAVEEDLL